MREIMHVVKQNDSASLGMDVGWPTLLGDIITKIREDVNQQGEARLVQE